MYSWREVVDFSQPLDATPAEPHADAAGERAAPERGRRPVCNPHGLGWSKPAPAGRYERPDCIHARAETMDTRRTFRDAFGHRRSILVVRTFNEGEELPNGKTTQYAPNDGPCWW